MEFREALRQLTTPQTVFPFIVGCGRSGTTLLQAMFDSHPRMAIAFKSYFIQDFAAARKRYEWPNGFVAGEAIEYLVTHYCFTRWGIDPSRVQEAFETVRPENLPDLLRMAFAIYAVSQGKTRYGDKSNRYADGTNMRMLADLFPEARFVHLIRDGRDVALSYLDVQWGPKSFAEAAAKWKQRVLDARNAGRSLGNDRYHEVRYEQLVEKPEETLRSLCDYFELEFHPAMFRYPERAEAIARPLRHANCQDSLHLPVTKGLRDWRSQAARKDIRDFESVAGDLLSELGYETLTSPQPDPANPERSRALAKGPGLDDPQDHRFVFIGGLHRSGTSLLFKSLKEHPRISGFEHTGAPEDEGQHLQDVYPTAKAHGGPGRFGFDSGSYLTECSPLVSEQNAQRLFRSWSRYWDLEKPYLVEKSPPNLVRTRFLQALFPDSYFVILLRHPIAISYSEHKRRPRLSIDSLLEHCLKCYERFDADRAHLSKVLVIKYEDFVQSPREILERIYAFLEIDSAPVTQEIRPDVNLTYFSQWEELRQGMPSGSEAAQLIQKFEKRANRFGYSLEDVGALASY